MPLRLFLVALFAISGCAEWLVAPEHRAYVARLEALAEAGDPLAQLELSGLLERGVFNDSTGAAVVGWPQDSTRAAALAAEAVRTFHARSERDDPEAQLHLGMLYHDGRGVARDTARAQRLWRAAARGGNAQAAFWLGMFAGAESSEAIGWLEQAFAGGKAGAAGALSHRYWRGRGVARDTAEAVAWLERAAAAGHEASVRDLRALVAYREGR